MKKKNNELAAEIIDDYERRKKARKDLETGWLININFLIGNQFAEILPNGKIEESAKQYYWQEHAVYNHIAPIIESRLSKFSGLKSAVTVKPSTGDTEDVNAAKFATKLLKSIEETNAMRKLTNDATFWSEVTGTAFYKVKWDSEKGGKVTDGESPMYEGDVDISVCPPYEIYPDNLSTCEVDDCLSIIHARVYPTSAIEDIWGVKVKGRKIDVINSDVTSSVGGYGYTDKVNRRICEQMDDQEVVIERYTAPTNEYPEGRLSIVAGDKLLYDGILPYINKERNKRGYPFIKQVCLAQPASFFGTSIIDRLIPLQRAYNAVKNRKHEYLNRIAMGVLVVEDGSIDLDDIEEEGIAPGKVLVYRQGSNMPVMANMGSVPNDFRDEEDRLLNEFVTVSGVSDFLTSSTINSSSVSGVTLNLIIEQDNNRLSLSGESIRNAVKEVGKHILRLYKQFATTKRLAKIAGDNGETQRISFCGSDITSDDIVFDVENEIVNSLANRKTMANELIKMGLLQDGEGKLNDATKMKLLEILGFGNWQTALNTDELHSQKAQLENQNIGVTIPKVLDVDNHELHIAEHAKYLIEKGDKINDEDKKVVTEHIRKHRLYARLIKEADALNDNNN